MSYLESKAQTLELLRTGKRVSIDTNVIVDAAQHEDIPFLETIASSEYFEPSVVLINELTGLAQHGRFTPSTSKLLLHFVKQTKSQVTPIDRPVLKQQLSLYAKLLPRSAPYLHKVHRTIAPSLSGVPSKSSHAHQNRPSCAQDTI